MMSPVAGTRGHHGWLWLPAIVTAGLVPVMYTVAAETERGSRAGAEPVIAGILVAMPFVVLFLVDLGCACHAWGEDTRAARRQALWGMSVASVLIAALVVSLVAQHAARGYLTPQGTMQAALLLAAVVLPVMPAWFMRPAAADRRPHT
jgi:hypothetical protein